MKKSYKSLTNVGKLNATLIKLLIPNDLEKVYKEVVDQAVWLANAHHGTIFLYDTKVNAFTRAYSTVPIAQQFLPRKNGSTYWSYMHNRPKLVSRKELLATHDSIDQKVHSVLLIPLSIPKKRFGVLSLQSTMTAPFDKQQKENLILYGTIASLAIKKAQLHLQNQKALETRDLFMSVASHEFKSPLSSIRAYAELEQFKSAAKKNISQKSVSAIIRNADRLTEMINSLFMVSQVSAGTFHSYKVDFNLHKVTKLTIVDLCMESKREVTFECNDKTMMFHGDKNQWVSVVTNIVRNAISYSQKNSPIVVSLQKLPTEITFTVTNKGKKISEYDLQNAFEKYYRAKHQKAGLGLGLFLCHQIVSAHNGTISIASKPRVANTVVVRLPLVRG